MEDVVSTEYSIDPGWLLAAILVAFVVVVALLVRAVVRSRGRARWALAAVAALAVAGLVWLAVAPVTIQRNGYPSSCAISDAVASGYRGPGNEKELALCRTAARRSLTIFFTAAGVVGLGTLLVPRRRH